MIIFLKKYKHKIMATALYLEYKAFSGLWRHYDLSKISTILAIEHDIQKLKLLFEQVKSWYIKSRKGAQLRTLYREKYIDQKDWDNNHSFEIQSDIKFSQQCEEMLFKINDHISSLQNKSTSFEDLFCKNKIEFFEDSPSHENEKKKVYKIYKKKKFVDLELNIPLIARGYYEQFKNMLILYSEEFEKDDYCIEIFDILYHYNQNYDDKIYEVVKNHHKFVDDNTQFYIKFYKKFMYLYEPFDTKQLLDIINNNIENFDHNIFSKGQRIDDNTYVFSGGKMNNHNMVYGICDLFLQWKNFRYIDFYNYLTDIINDNIRGLNKQDISLALNIENAFITYFRYAGLDLNKKVLLLALNTNLMLLLNYHPNKYYLQEFLQGNASLIISNFTTIIKDIHIMDYYRALFNNGYSSFILFTKNQASKIIITEAELQRLMKIYSLSSLEETKKFYTLTYRLINNTLINMEKEAYIELNHQKLIIFYEENPVFLSLIKNITNF